MVVFFWIFIRVCVYIIERVFLSLIFFGGVFCSLFCLVCYIYIYIIFLISLLSLLVVPPNFVFWGNGSSCLFRYINVNQKMCCFTSISIHSVSIATNYYLFRFPKMEGPIFNTYPGCLRTLQDTLLYQITFKNTPQKRSFIITRPTKY